MFYYLKSLYKYRELILNLVIRAIQSRYRQSILGKLWIILNPLSLMVIYTLVFSKLARISSDHLPYPLFVYTGLMVWSYFASGVGNATNSLLQNVNLVKKVFFPREIFPITAICSAGVDFFIAVIPFIGLIIAYRIPLTWNLFLVIPVFLIQTLFILGLSLFLSALNVFYRDTGMIMQLIFTLWMFLSPVAYPVTLVPERFQSLYMLNPMAGIIEGYRNVLLHGVPPDFYLLGYTTLVTGIILLLSYTYFKKVEMRFADEI